MKKIRIYLFWALFIVISINAWAGSNNTTEIQDTTIKGVLIGNQIWMTENLKVDTFRNGDIILQAKSFAEWQASAQNKQPVWNYYDLINKLSYPVYHRYTVLWKQIGKILS